MKQDEPEEVEKVDRENDGIDVIATIKCEEDVADRTIGALEESSQLPMQGMNSF